VYCLVAIPLASLAAGLYLGRGASRFVVLATLCLSIFGSSVAVLAFAGRQAIQRTPGLQPRARLRNVLLGSWIALCIVALFGVVGNVAGPVPMVPSTPPNGAYSLRATASDLAALLIEVSDPRFLDPDLREQMRAAQVPVNSDNSWGLGVGIQHCSRGDSLWHSGDNPDFKSLVVIYPEIGFGAVVLTNGDGGAPVAFDVTHRSLGGKAAFSYRD
jgi:hypothetical protein